MTVLAILCVAVLLFLLSVQDIRGRVKVLGTMAACAVWLSIASLYITLPGTPKPVAMETADVEVAEVLWSGETSDRIYLLLTWPGVKEPRYYWMDRTPSRSQQLQQAKIKATALHRPLLVRDPFDQFGTEDGEPGQGDGNHQDSGDNETDDGMFYTAPPPPLPEKR